MQRYDINQNLLIRMQKADTMDDVALLLTEVQQMFGFRYYCVFETARLDEEEPISFLFPSNVPADLFYKIDERMAAFAARLSTHLPGTLGPMPWDLAEVEARGEIEPETAAFYRAAGFIMAITFPALGVSSLPRLIGFAGDRPHLEEDEVERLSMLMFHMHIRLTMIGRARTEKRQPLSGLEKEILFLAADGESFEAISAKVALSSITMSYLMESICRKMEVSTFEHAVAVTLRRGLSR